MIAAELLGDAARSLGYVAAMLLFGGQLFMLALARPAWRAAGAGPGVMAALDRALWGAALGALTAAAVSLLLWLWSTAALLSDAPLDAALAPDLLGAVITETSFGRVLVARLVLLAILAGLLVGGGASRGRRAAAGLILAAAFLGSIMLTGHAYADAGAGRAWHMGADAIHLLAAGAWLGGLPFLLIVLRSAAPPGAGEWSALAGALVPRYSRLGILSVAVLLTAGLVNAGFTLGSLAALTGSRYGTVLSIKLGVFIAMLALAAYNRNELVPRIAGGASGQAGAALRRLAATSLIEIVLGLAVLADVGVLVSTAPAAHGAP